MEQLLLTLISIGFVLVLIGVIRRGIQQKVTVRNWIFAISAVVLIPFGLAWCATSFGENEPTAGYMGIFVFSGLGVVSALLAHTGFFPNASEKKVKKPNPAPIGTIILTLVLVVLIAFTLPWSMVTRNISKTLSNPEQVQQMVTQQVLSDNALPYVIKKGLTYQTLYGDYPSHLKYRMIQSMLSGTDDDEINRLLGHILPEEERIALIEGLIESVRVWLSNDDPYPNYTLEPATYFNRINGNPEFLVRWIYLNFTLPEMRKDKVEAIAAGNFSENFDDYMQMPPDSLKEQIIIPAANALKDQLASAEVPATVQIGEEMKASLEETEVLQIKQNVKRASGVLKSLWILPVFILVALAFTIFRFIEKDEKLKWSAFSLIGIGLLGLLFSSPLQNSYKTTGEIILMLSEKAPPPALALVEALVYPLLEKSAGPALMALYSITIAGLVLLIVAYANNMKAFVDDIKTKILTYGKDKKAVKA